MNAATKAPAVRMSMTEIESELAQLKEEGRQDSFSYGHRDFKTEAEQADAQEADEIRAEQTLYSGRQRKRAARCNELETALTALKAADVSKTLDSLSAAHGEALVTAQAALEDIDFDALTRFEKQVSAYLLAEERVRKHACKAADIAKNAGANANGLASIHAPVLGATYDRLERLKAQIASSSQRLSHDHSRIGVSFIAI